MKIYIRKISLNEKNQRILQRLKRLCFNYPQDRQTNNCEWWFAYVDGQPVGFGALEIEKNNEAQLALSGVIVKHRGKGIHKRLIKARINYAKKHNIKSVNTYASVFNTQSIKNLLYFNFEILSKDKEFSYFQLNLK